VPSSTPRYAWYRDLSRYHWFVLGVACVGWMFDSMAQQIFNLARKPAIRELMGSGYSDAAAAYSISVFMIGWAVGGIVFGILGDRIGRVKTMVWTILSYTIFTGLSMFATGIWDFDAYRFLCGLGVGGQFAVGAVLVAEVVPARARPYALGTLQSFSLVGNIVAALVGISLGFIERSGAIAGAWRWEFLAGALPAPLAFVVFRKLKDPEPWLKARAENRKLGKKLGSYRELFGDARWKRNALVGLVLSVVGVVGLWGIAYLSYDLFLPVLEKTFRAQGFSGTALAGKTTTWMGIVSMFFNIGGFLGVHAFTYLTHYSGRRKAFALSFVVAMVVTAYTFWNLRAIVDIFWLVPLMGFAVLLPFGGYAIYLPELFPTRLRSTGTSFCYNVGRGLAAAGPFTFAYLTTSVFAHHAEPMRYTGVAMCLVFLVGLAVLPFAPETKGEPLPE